MKKIFIPIIIIIAVGLIGWWFMTDNKVEEPTSISTPTTIDDNKDGTNSIVDTKADEVYTASIEADQQFGFLIGGFADEMKVARDTGVGWIRPHPGPFVWRDMQTSADSEIDFSQTDDMVAASAIYDINILPTIWHYAEWDQKNNANSNKCLASSGEFENEFGKYRCIPTNWDAYTAWVTAIVERYDGDGVNDMPNLKKPITHWEVMNEPDLGTPDGSPGLQFLIGPPSDYAELLKKTSAAIRGADPNAKILIAGAAGGNEMFLNYFREVFKDPATREAFDIANVHCISNDDVDTFNVAPYSAMLKEFGIDKPIWVTEAEAFISSDKEIVAKQLLESSKSALEFGATKIFFTSMNIDHIPGQDNKDEKDKLLEKEAGPQASTEVYQNIFNTL